MRELLYTSLPNWLRTFLVSICALFLFVFFAAPEIHLLGVAGVLFLWTWFITLVDAKTRPAAVVGVMIAALVFPFVIWDGTSVFSYLVAVLTGEETELILLNDAVVLMGLSVISVAVQYLMRIFWFRIILSIVWIGFWIWAAVMEWELSRVPIAAMAVILLMTYVEILHRRKMESTQYNQLTVSVSVLATVLGLLMLVLPVSPEPYPYPLINAIIDRAEEMYDDMVTELLFREEGEGQFTMDFSGYTEEGDMGGASVGGHGFSGIRAKTALSTDGSLYLIGNTWDTFGNGAWANSLSESQSDLLDWNLDTVERIYALWRYQQEHDTPGVTTYMRHNSVYMQYEEVSIRTLFTAPDAFYISTDRERFPWNNQPGGVLFDYLQTRDTYYRVHFLEQNDARLPELVNASEGYVYGTDDEQKWLKIFGDYRPEFGLTLELFDTNQEVEPILAQRQELIYNTYLQLPGELSDAVRTLAEEITRDCDSNYEKLTAIAEYLQKNYTYTTQPAPIPEGVDFLDYILFETDEGYCTWYATAATMLGRCVGVPTRYVQGYCIPLEGSVPTILEDADSHAWCEGYLPGFGWITVEATPGADTAGDGWDAVTPDREEEPEEEEPEIPDEPEKEAEEHTSVLNVKTVGISLGLVSLVGITVLLIRGRKRQMRYQRASWSGKTVMDLEQFLTSNVRRELRRRTDESVRQYFERLRWMLQLDVERMNGMTQLYEEVLFAERELTEEEWRESREFLSALSKTCH
ncbi:MAG: transglutaminase domain-containing protein [Oscillospiraceae bacterium]|nr:transglutaminase domain-containing protein [Oscillospiraceae bacterium]